MKFSIITPSFKQLDWLRLCVASVRDQVAAKAEGGNQEPRTKNQEPRTKNQEPRTKNPPPPLAVEHIIQDAGTPGIEECAREIGAEFYRDGFQIVDSSLQIADSGRANNPPSTISNQQSRYRIAIYCERDAGMYDAINRGLKRAQGEIFSYLNCDEQYLPGTIEKVWAVFSGNPACEVLFGDAIVVDPQGKYLCDRRVLKPGNWHTRVSGNLSIFTSSTFFRASVITQKRLFFRDDWKALGDAVWALDLLAAGVRMQTIKTPLSTHTDTGENLILSPTARDEMKKLQATAPGIARLLDWLIVQQYRVRRFLAGAYSIKPHIYRIFTLASRSQRVGFDVEQPRFQWRK